jgi:hypothetical protein
VRLSEIRNWDTGHLTAGASQWTTAAASWADTFTVASREARNPGGTEWNGAAAEAAQLRTEADRTRVLGLSDVLNGMATTARTGAADVVAARERVLAVVARAGEAGFDVRDDFAVVNRASAVPAGLHASRQAQCDTIAAELCTAVWTMNCVAASGGGWDCYFRVDNGWYTEHFYVPP